MSSSSWISLLFTVPSLLAIIVFLALVWTFTSVLQPVKGGKGKRPFNAKPKKNSPPGPPTLPLLGNLHMLGSLPHQSLHKLAIRYGPIMSLRLGLVPTIVISSSHFAEQFLKTNDSSFASRASTEAGKHLSYGSKGVAFSPYGPYWRSLRRLCTSELLSHAKVESFSPLRKEALCGLVRSLEDIAEAGGVADLSEMVGSVSASITCRMVLGDEYADINGVVELVHEGMRLVGAFNVGDFIPRLAFFDLQGLRRRMKAFHRVFDELFEKIIDERVEGGGRGQKEAFVDAMVRLMESEAAEGRVTRTNVKAVMSDMLTGSMDTSSTAIEWALAELLKNPRVLKKLQQELERVVGRDRMVEESDLRNVEYLDMVVKETLRLHPVAPLLMPHEATEDCTVEDFDVAKGSRIIINARAIGRDPNVWSNPEEFYPERFAGADVDVKGRHFQLIPFGSGRRSCPGMNLGLALFRLSLAQLVHCFDWKLPNGMRPSDLDMSERFSLVVPRAHHLLALPFYRLHRI